MLSPWVKGHVIRLCSECGFLISHRVHAIVTQYAMLLRLDDGVPHIASKPNEVGNAKILLWYQTIRTSDEIENCYYYILAPK